MRGGSPVRVSSSLTLHSLAGGRKIFFFPATTHQFEATTTQTMRSCHNSKLLLYSNELLFKTTPPNFFISSIKACSSPLSSRLVYSLPLVTCPKLKFLCYSQISSFANLSGLIFKDDTINGNLQHWRWLMDVSFSLFVSLLSFFLKNVRKSHLLG